jgi:hypothetical protein
MTLQVTKHVWWESPLGNLSDIVMQRIKEIVSNEHRPVSFLDFLPSFETEGKEYSMKYGTLRNTLSSLRRTQQIQIAFKTKQTFYTLPGITFGRSKVMTPYHTGVSSILAGIVLGREARVPLSLEVVKPDTIN